MTSAEIHELARALAPLVAMELKKVESTPRPMSLVEETSHILATQGPDALAAILKARLKKGNSHGKH